MRRKPRTTAAAPALARAAACLMLLAGALAPAAAAPRAELWERWTAHDPRSQATVDHAAWGRVLAAVP